MEFLNDGTYGLVYKCKLDGKEAIFKRSTYAHVNAYEDTANKAHAEQILEAYSQLKVACNLQGKGLLKIPRILKLRSVVDNKSNLRQNLIFMEKLKGTLCGHIDEKVIRTVALTLLAFEQRGWAHGDVKCNNMMKSGENLYLIDFGMFKDGLNPEEARQYAAANMAYFILSESYNKKLPIPDKIKQKLEAYAKS